MSDDVLIIASDEFGRYWVFDFEMDPIAGPYDTLDDAQAAYITAEWNGS